ncbi:hypothetical protein TD95_004432 [Thielaviopsis punctulata]|uniref:Chromosome segregation in meiosis protein n=1 Tax=Thielaviopsis punctulata TaxID=72032 RepID=A0A0F4ZEJ8_9PEZI|nr:hypothetical protein TD95_004432 [Thielaviopsis punctulata]
MDDSVFDLDDYGFENPFKDDEQKQPVVKKDIVGIDDEIKVKRTRAPAVKLDETLLASPQAPSRSLSVSVSNKYPLFSLLSAKGIPKLKSRAKKLKFRGKGHEWSDAFDLLSLYRLWLDDLYPKARFVDALAMVEKAGHKTTMIKQRTAWLDEAARKNGSVFDSVDVHDAGAVTVDHPRAVDRRPATPDTSGGFMVDHGGDLYDASPRRTLSAAGVAKTTTKTTGNTTSQDKDVPDSDDDLEAMMAEAQEFDSFVATQSATVSKPTAASEIDYNPEDELMAEIPFEY